MTVSIIIGLFLLILYINDSYSSDETSDLPVKSVDGIDSDYYEDALFIFNQLSSVLDNEDYDFHNTEKGDEIASILADNARSIEANPSAYTEKEIQINESLIHMVVNLPLLDSEVYEDDYELYNDIVDHQTIVLNLMEIE